MNKQNDYKNIFKDIEVVDLDEKVMEVLYDKRKECEKHMLYISDYLWLWFPDFVIEGENPTIGDCLNQIEAHKKKLEERNLAVKQFNNLIKDITIKTMKKQAKRLKKKDKSKC